MSLPPQRHMHRLVNLIDLFGPFYSHLLRDPLPRKLGHGSYPSSGTWDKKTSRSVTLFNGGMDDVHSSLTFIVLSETFFLFLACSWLFSFHKVANKLFLL